MPLYRLLLPLIIALTATACSPSGTPPSAEEWTTLGFRPATSDLKVPDIEFIDEKGVLRSLEEFRGSVVLLNFWASWCPPCRAEMPAMERLAAALEGNSFVMVPLNVGESPDMVDAFVKEFGIGFPVYYDETEAAARIIGITALPTTIMIDREGLAVSTVTGSLEWDDGAIVSALDFWTR